MQLMASDRPQFADGDRLGGSDTEVGRPDLEAAAMHTWKTRTD